MLPFVLLHPIFKSAMMLLLFLLGKYPYYYSKSKCNGRKEGRRKKLGKDVLCPTFSPLTDRTSTLQIRSSQHRDFTSLNFFLGFLNTVKYKKRIANLPEVISSYRVEMCQGWWCYSTLSSLIVSL